MTSLPTHSPTERHVASDLKQHLNREQDEGLEMDVFATNTSVSSNVADHPGFMGGSWDLPEGGYTTPAGF